MSTAAEANRRNTNRKNCSIQFSVINAGAHTLSLKFDHIHCSNKVTLIFEFKLIFHFKGKSFTETTEAVSFFNEIFK